MKIKKDFLCRMVAGRYVVVAVNEASIHFNKMIAMNETSHFIWECLQEEKTEEELLQAILAKYDIDEAQAREDLTGFLKVLTQQGCLENV